MITGNWKNARAEKLAMAEGQNSTGGFLFGDSFSRTVIDYARNQAAVVKAGAATVPWSGSDQLIMARVYADPTFQVVPENTEFTERTLTFDAISFTANKIGCLISMSRELAEDASNAAAIVEQTLSRALATEIDRIALVGSGRAEPDGLLNYTSVSSTDSIGAIAWQDPHNAVVAVQNGNFEPSGYICSPTIGGDLDIILASTSGNWLSAPPSMANCPRFKTKNCPDANLFVGQWDQLAIGLRQDALLEVSTTAGNAFAKHQVWIKITWRGDIGVFNSAAFHVLKGITT